MSGRLCKSRRDYCHSACRFLLLLLLITATFQTAPCAFALPRLIEQSKQMVLSVYFTGVVSLLDMKDCLHSFSGDNQVFCVLQIRQSKSEKETCKPSFDHVNILSQHKRMPHIKGDGSSSSWQGESILDHFPGPWYFCIDSFRIIIKNFSCAFSPITAL